MLLLTKAVALQGTPVLGCYLKAGTAVGFRNARLRSLIVASVSKIIHSFFFPNTGLEKQQKDTHWLQ